MNSAVLGQLELSLRLKTQISCSAVHNTCATLTTERCVLWVLGRLLFESLRILSRRRRMKMKFKDVYCKMFVYKVQIVKLRTTFFFLLPKRTHKDGAIFCPHSALRVFLRVVTRAERFQGCYNELTCVLLLPPALVLLHH